jgi:hypothetical protein
MNNSLAELQQYLQDRVSLLKEIRPNQGWKYIGIEELLLDRGTVMEAKPLPKTIKRGLSKSCYHNCQKIAFKQNDFTYVEGYAVAEEISLAIAHAWLMTPEGSAIDPTWDEPGTAYLGIPFSTNWVKSIIAARKQRGREDDLSILEGNYIEGFSLLKEGLPDEAYGKL